jgi:transcriptional regulator with XRE-family HTH domain
LQVLNEIFCHTLNNYSKIRTTIEFYNLDICNMLSALVGKNIKKMRILFELPQSDLEFAANISHTTLSRIENGHGTIDIDRLEKIAEVFKVDVCTIIRFSDTDSYQHGLPIPANVEEGKTEYSKVDVDLAKSQEQLKMYKSELVHLKEKTNTLEDRLKDKDRIIALLSGEGYKP